MTQADYEERYQALAKRTEELLATATCETAKAHVENWFERQVDKLDAEFMKGAK